jgi:hypothetical protein
MTPETLHAPHGAQTYTCPKCHQTFAALFLFNRHAREVHGDRKI